MKEDFIQYIWIYKLFNQIELRTTNGQKLTIHRFGTQNSNAGPDFLYCEIELDNIKWIGPIEMHVNSSMWNLHNHHNDSSYNSVILHVVWEDDAPVLTKNKRVLPTLTLKGLVKKQIYDNYEQLLNQKSWIPCETMLHKVNTERIPFWAYSLNIERLELKSISILRSLQENQNNFEQSLILLVFRSISPSINKDSFGLLAQKTSFSTLKKINDISSIESYLFGLSGLLPEDAKTTYEKNLIRYYHFLKTKFQLDSMQADQWKFHRMRPPGFPTILIALLARLIYSSFPIFDRLLESSIETIRNELLQINASEFWNTHYNFKSEHHPPRIKNLTQNRIDLIIINAFAPMLYTYGKIMKLDKFKNKGVHLLESLPLEKNNIVNKWKTLHIPMHSAKDSQAFIHLKKHYCNKFRCTSCQIGHQILNN